jgi:triosephosphate isomerase
VSFSKSVYKYCIDTQFNLIYNIDSTTVLRGIFKNLNRNSQFQRLSLIHHIQRTMAATGNKFFVGGNWKLNGTRESIEALVNTYNNGGKFPSSVEVVVAPTALHIGYVQSKMRPDVAMCAQNVSSDSGFGALTGELTADLFKAWGINWTIAGHSERRRRKQIRGLGHDEESNSVAKKTKHALNCGMKVIVCIGETLADREAGTTLNVCFEQLTFIKETISVEEWARIVIAYEPVWAIGTGLSASPEQAQEVHASLRRWLLTNLNSEVASATRIIYGGSVKPTNASALIACPDIDGFLVGGCSLKSDFMEIINCCPPEWDSTARSELGKRAANDIQSIGADGKKSKQ